MRFTNNVWECDIKVCPLPLKTLVNKTKDCAGTLGSLGHVLEM